MFLLCPGRTGVGRLRQQRPLGTSHECGSCNSRSEKRWTISRNARNATSVVASVIGPVTAESEIEEGNEEKVRGKEPNLVRIWVHPQVPSLASP